MLVDMFGRPLRSRYVNTPGQPETVKRGARLHAFSDWRKAAEASVLSRKAISRKLPQEIAMLLGIPYTDPPDSWPVCIVMAVKGDAYFVYHSRPGVPIEPRVKVPTKLIDGVSEQRGWLAYDGEVA